MKTAAKLLTLLLATCLAAPHVHAPAYSYGCVIAIDETHSEYTIANGKMADFANLLSASGYTVVRFTDAPITVDKLRQYDVFIMVRVSDMYPPSTAELDALIQYINGGGSVVILGGNVDVIQSIAEYFGFRVGDGYVGEAPPNFEDGVPTWIKCSSFNPYDPITMGLSTVIFYDAGYFVEEYYITPNPNFVGSSWAVYSSSDAWADLDYDRARDPDEPTIGKRPIVLSARGQLGKLIMVLDSDVFTSDDTDMDGEINLYEYDNEKFALNIVRELCLRCVNDRDCDGVPDHQDKCPDDPGPAENCGCPCEGFGGKVDVVFVIDTSGSMDEEWSILCSVINTIVSELKGYGLDVQYKIYGLGHTRDCATDSIMSHEEDWGPGTQWVASNHPWRQGAARAVIPISDEGPYHGCPVDSQDDSSIDQAIAACKSSNVRAYPILGHTPTSCYSDTWSEMLRLASETGGKAFKLTDPAQDIASMIKSAIVHAACDRDGDGVPDCEDLCPDTPGVPPGGCPPDQCDRDGDGVPDCEDLCPEIPGPPPSGCPVFFAFAPDLPCTFENIPSLFRTDTKLVYGRWYPSEGFWNPETIDCAGGSLLEYAAAEAGMDPLEPVFDHQVINLSTLEWIDMTSNLIAVGGGVVNAVAAKIQSMAGIGFEAIPGGARLTVSGLGSWDWYSNMTGYRDYFVVALVHESEPGIDRNLMLIAGVTGWGTMAGCLYMSDPDTWSALAGYHILVVMWEDSNHNGKVDPLGVDAYTILAVG